MESAPPRKRVVRVVITVCGSSGATCPLPCSPVESSSGGSSRDFSAFGDPGLQPGRAPRLWRRRLGSRLERALPDNGRGGERRAVRRAVAERRDRRLV